LVIETAYDEAQTLFHDLTGVSLGSERMHTLTNRAAEGLSVLDIAPSREQIDEHIAEGVSRIDFCSGEMASASGGARYRWRHRGHTSYLRLRRGGYPLGSGGIESANKFICHTRLKRSGAWWYENNCNQMLALRCAKYNGTLDQVFVRHQERLRAA
jgi:hypothetical protein